MSEPRVSSKAQKFAWGHRVQCEMGSCRRRGTQTIDWQATGHSIIWREVFCPSHAADMAAVFEATS